MCPKYDLIVLNKCAQHCKLRTKNTLAGVVVLTMRVANYLYVSYITDTLYK